MHHMYLPISRAKYTMLLFEKMKTQHSLSVIFHTAKNTDTSYVFTYIKDKVNNVVI